MRVPQFLADQHVAFETVVHPPAFTAQRLAKDLRVSGRQVVKSVVLVSGPRYFLAVLPATMHVDLDAAGRFLEGPVRLATEAELAERFSGCEFGARAPFGHLFGLTTLLDASISRDATILFEAEQHAVAIRMTCADYERLERPRRCALGRAG
jgi:Ala-tRNA(Pro) deacylase